MKRVMWILLNRLFAVSLVKRKQKTKNMNPKLDGSEASMIPLLASSAADLIDSPNADYFSFEEFSVGRGIADIYIVSKNSQTFTKRKRSNIPAITDRLQNEIVSFLWEHNGTPYHELNSLLQGRKLQNLDFHLQKLIELRALFIDDEKVFVQEPANADIIDYSVAIEAKVSDWRKGLKQALRYKNFADRSYLALYENHIKSARNNLSVFETLNIGLIGVSDDGINVYFKPTINTKDPVKARLASERAYSLIDDTQDGFVARNNLVTYRSAA